MMAAPPPPRALHLSRGPQDPEGSEGSEGPEGPEVPAHTTAELWQWLTDPPMPTKRTRQTAFGRSPRVEMRALHSVTQCRSRAQRRRRQVLGHLWRMELSLAGEHEVPQAQQLSLSGLPDE